MKGLSEDRRALVDAMGKHYPFRPLMWKLLDTIVRTIGVVALLYLVALAWEIFH